MNKHLHEENDDYLQVLFENVKTIADLQSLAKLPRRHPRFETKLGQAEGYLCKWAVDAENLLSICTQLPHWEEHTYTTRYLLVGFHQYLHGLKELAQAIEQISAKIETKKLAKIAKQHVIEIEHYLHQCHCDDKHLINLSAQLQSQRSRRLEGNTEHNEYLHLLIGIMQYRHWMQKTGCREWENCQRFLIQELEQLRELRRSSHPSANDIVNATWRNVLERIHEFVLPLPEKTNEIKKELAYWINSKLRLWDNLGKLPEEDAKERKRYTSLDQLIGSHENGKPISLGDSLADPRPSTIWEILDEIEKDWYRQAEWFIAKEAIKYFEQDPDEILRRFCSRKYPQLNLQEIIKRYYLTFPPQKDSVIVRDLNINRQRPGHAVRELKEKLAKRYGLPFPPEKKSKTYPVAYVVIEFYCELAALELAKNVVATINLIVHLPTCIQQLSFRLIDQIFIELEH